MRKFANENCLNRHSAFLKRFYLLLFIVVGFSATSFCQQSITGRVFGADHTALAGVTVQVKGSNTTTQTNNAGNFSINAAANATLVFSYVGLATQEIYVGSRHEIEVQLLPTTQSLSDVVVVGYGTQKKTSLTSS